LDVVPAWKAQRLTRATGVNAGVEQWVQLWRGPLLGPVEDSQHVNFLVHFVNSDER
jgi:hypothetical protein